ncbi:abortive infection protein [Paenibacillus aceris]|uniref:Abortive infection protein n=1 Tax=Paenibacillus aceris TaxID=869555 RepID=A0ABS4I0I9_9BACL|nr:abortive infection protein [Paenibacillus aceris]MBP1964427.1 hypothetical protein [Paenibacillus aceris]NHW35859.1 abortive infection protein [Paenibacillus aceris]
MTNNAKFERKGINYDVGTFTRSKDQSSRELFDPIVVAREMEIIKNDLHCNAVRISGQDISRLTLASEYALKLGLEVWFSPAFINATEQETLTYLAECAKAAENLRKHSSALIFVVGCELTFFMKGLVIGDTAFDRIQTFMKPWRLIKNTILKGSFHKRLNSFLGRAVGVVREHFHGQLTYASGSWENVNWAPFDYVGIDYYREKFNQKTYREKLKAYFSHGKPVVVLEFGCCTYQGAEDKGGYGWAIVDRTQTPNRLNGEYMRDEHVQVAYMTELLSIFKEECVNGAFWFTFVMPFYPYSDDPPYNLDTASYSIVKTYPDQQGTTYADMNWEPKEAFQALAQIYRES